MIARISRANGGLIQRDVRKAQAALQSKLDDPAFAPTKSFTHGTQTTEAAKNGADYVLTALGFGDKVAPYKVERVIGHDPLRQFLVERPGGRMQTLEVAFDPKPLSVSTQ